MLLSQLKSDMSSSSNASTKRLYTELMEQAGKNIDKFYFNILSEGLSDYQDWVVARINFSESTNESKASGILFTIDIYHFRDGFLRVDVEAKQDGSSKTINIKFSLSKAEVDVKGLDQNAGDDYLINIIDRLRNNFDKKNFKFGERDYFNLALAVKWIPQEKIAKQQQAYYEKCQKIKDSALIILAVGIVSVGILTIYLIKRSKGK